MKLHTYEDLTQAELVLSAAGQQMSVSIYLIDGLLIDTGASRKKKELSTLFQEWAFDEVILTHHHEDHTGMASWLEQNKNVPIYIHESGIENCTAAEKLPFYRKIFWGEREPFQPIELADVHKTANYTWDIIHTPGHAHDHVALYNREKRWLFGGDLFIQSTPKSLFAFESVPEIIDSLKKLLTYEFDVYICSHAGVLPNGRQALEKKLRYLQGIEQQVLSLYNEGKSKRSIRKRLFPKTHPMNYLSLFENSPQHIVNSILR